MHIIRNFIFILFCFLPLYSNNFLHNFLNKSEIKYLNNKKSIKVFIYKDWAPKDSNEFPQIYNYLKEYIKLYEKILGIHIKIVTDIKYNDNVNIIKKNRIDIILSLKRNEHREKFYTFSKNKIYDIYYSFAIPKNSKIPTLEKLNFNKQSLAVVSNSLALKYIRETYPDIKLIECETNFDTLKFVLRKKADYAFGNYYVFDYLIYKNFLSGFKIKTQIEDTNIKQIPTYFAFDKNSTILKDIFYKAYKQIDKEEIYILQNKWLKLPVSRKIFLTKSEKNFIKNYIIRVNTTTSWLPFNFVNQEGDIVGIGIDYWKLIAGKVHLKYHFYKAKNFPEVLNNIKNKKFDVNMATSKTLDKESYALFTKRYEKFPIAIATKKINHFITTGVDLEHKKVAVGKSYSTYYLLRTMYPKINFILTKDTKEALQFVHDDKAFAAVDIEPSLRYQIIKNGFKDIFITGITGVDFNLQIMVRKDYGLLVSILNKAINAITNSERIEIYKKWMGVRKKEINYKLIVEISIIFILITATLLFFYFRQRKLKNKLAQLNETLEKKIEIAIKEDRKHQMIMLQQSRLAQMGEAISLIAHQWKQPLNALAFLNSTLVSKYKNNTLTQEAVDKFEKRSLSIIKGMSATIDNFRNFFKPEKEQVEFSINDVITNIIDIMQPILDESKIKMIVILDEDRTIIGYPNEFSQALMNIINNAKEALIQNHIKDKKIIIKKSVTDDLINIIIQDNAGGIDETILDRVVEPYFTTKSDMGGDGIGLYMTKLIIEKHMGGSLKLANITDGLQVKISFKC